MKKALIIFGFIVYAYNLSSQNIEDLTFGTDSTFEAVTWNIEWFPKSGQTTVAYVTEIIQALDVDLLALQEIDNKSAFQQMLDDLDNWEGYFINGEYQGLAFIYKTESLEVLDIYEIYTENWREFPRPPLVMELLYRNELFIIINNHLKCCGDGIMDPYDPWDEETRRYDAGILLEQYIDHYHFTDRVILLGDLNDILTDNPVNNVFQVFLDNQDDYLFTDIAIAEGNSSEWSYPSWPSHLDHIMISNEMFGMFGNGGSEIQTIKIDEYLGGGFNQYDAYISDHRPVGLKLMPDPDMSIELLTDTEEIFYNYPNPFKSFTTFIFSSDSGYTQIIIHNIAGKEIQIFSIGQNQSMITWDAGNLTDGLYYVISKKGNKIIDIHKIIKTK